MADDVDIANDFIANEVSRALGAVRQSSNVKHGRKTCIECNETLPAARRKLGFQLCVPCASEIERRRSMYAAY